MRDKIDTPNQGRIQDFKLGEGAFKKIAPSRGRREYFWGISCEKSRYFGTVSTVWYLILIYLPSWFELVIVTHDLITFMV
jgi:hypothetical protein